METLIYVWKGHMTWTVMKTCSIINPKCWMIHSCKSKKKDFKAVTEDVSAVSHIPKSTLFMNGIESLFLYLSLSGEWKLVSGLRQVVLALLTLSNDGCRSLHRHNMAAEREIKKRKETEMEERCTRTEDGSRGVKKERLWIMWENQRMISGRKIKGLKVRKRRIMWGEVKKTGAERR